MLDYNTDSRLQAVRDHADRLASDMRRSRSLSPDEAGFPGRARLVSAIARVGHLRGRRHAPVYQA